MGFSFIKVKMKIITKGRAERTTKRFLEDLKKSDFIHHSHWKFGPCFRCALNFSRINGRIYTRRRLRRPDALNVGLLSASSSESRFYTRGLKSLRRLIHLLSASIGRT